MRRSSAEPDVGPEDVASPDALVLRRAYAADLAAVLGAAVALDPDALPTDADLAPPEGCFWVARADGEPVGCVGARALATGDVEVKRLFVVPAGRGRGTAQRLLGAVERWASGRRARRVVLDTAADLVAAVGLYQRAGFVEVEPYNDNPHAELWFAKPLDGSAPPGD